MDLEEGLDLGEDTVERATLDEREMQYLYQDGDDYYFDVSQRVANLDYALELARDRGEIAIWDVANGREVRA